MKKQFDEYLNSKIRSELSNLRPRYSFLDWISLEWKLRRFNALTQINFYSRLFFSWVLSVGFLMSPMAIYESSIEKNFPLKSEQLVQIKGESEPINSIISSEEKAISVQETVQASISEKEKINTQRVYYEIVPLNVSNELNHIEVVTSVYDNSNFNLVAFRSEKRKFKKKLGVSLISSLTASYNTLTPLKKSNFGAGLTFDYSIGRNIEIFSGFLYQRQNGSSSINSEEKTYSYVRSAINKYSPEPVYADLHILDIPIGVNVFFNQKKKGMYFSTSLSNYVYVSEDYNHTIQSQNGDQNRSFTFTESFGVFHRSDWASALNFSLGFRKNTSLTTALGIEPFVKLPLKGLGTHKLKLQGAGVSLKLSFLGR